MLLAFVAINASAQDVIVKKDGSTILSKVLEVSSTDIKYKKFSNPDGPTYKSERYGAGASLCHHSPRLQR